MIDRPDVVVVGAGPAGAALASLLAERGRSVLVLERRRAYGWRACGVFAGPAVRPYLTALGMPRPDGAGTARTVPAMRLETARGTTVRLTYGADRGGPPALAFDRRRLDEALVERAIASGASVRAGARVERVVLERDRPVVAARDGGIRFEVEAAVVVGADGIRSVVAAAAGVARPPRLSRVGLTYHVAELPARPGGGRDDAADSAADAPDGAPEPPADARMVVLPNAYCGLAPVPGRRVNVGLVLRPPNVDALARDGTSATAARLLASVRPVHEPDVARIAPQSAPLDRPAGAAPLGHRVTRRSGRTWLLVGDAAGFLDPFTGEGLHRALASAFLAAEAIDRHLGGRSRGLEDYDRAMRSRFRAKDAVSLLVQAFLARPAAFEYATRRLAARPPVRRVLEAVVADLAPASGAFDPRFLAALLAP